MGPHTGWILGASPARSVESVGRQGGVQIVEASFLRIDIHARTALVANQRESLRSPPYLPQYPPYWFGAGAVIHYGTAAPVAQTQIHVRGRTLQCSEAGPHPEISACDLFAQRFALPPQPVEPGIGLSTLCPKSGSTKRLLRPDVQVANMRSSGCALGLSGHGSA
jgi:hypothetical protein